MIICHNEVDQRAGKTNPSSDSQRPPQPSTKHRSTTSCQPAALRAALPELELRASRQATNVARNTRGQNQKKCRRAALDRDARISTPPDAFKCDPKVILTANLGGSEMGSALRFDWAVRQGCVWKIASMCHDLRLPGPTVSADPLVVLSSERRAHGVIVTLGDTIRFSRQRSWQM